MMSKKQIVELVNDLTSDGRHGDDAAFDIAEGILFDEVGLEAGIKKHFGVRDAQGWLANKIAQIIKITKFVFRESGYLGKRLYI